MTRTRVLYHGNCCDGFAAAFAAWLKFGDEAQYVPCFYDGTEVDVAGCDVFVLDFSFEPAVLDRMAAVATSLVQLDHHAKAQAKLQGYRLPCCGKVHFDIDKSGAVLAWEHFHPDTPVPQLMRFVQTRDLWRWDTPGMEDARHFLTWLDFKPRDFQQWKAILELSADGYRQAITEGAAMAAKFESMCRDVVAQASPVTVAGVPGLMVNANPVFKDEVGSELARQCGTFGLIWNMEPGGRIKCSLRSNKPFDVAVLAAEFGGSGHDQAAGFYLPASALPDLAAGRLTRTRARA